MPGFKLGFISDFNLYYPFDVRTLLQVSFSEFRMDYYYVDGSVFSDTRPSTFLESPVLIKYKSKRRKNHRMFIIAGFKPSLEIGAKNKDEAGKDILDLKSFDISFALGFGSDIFFQLFKLSPEIRYSRGLRNVLNKKNINEYNLPTWLRDLTGILKLSFAWMLHFSDPRIVVAGSFGITLLMLAAVVTHVRLKSTFRRYIASVTMLLLSITILYFSVA